ncbi:hypothetical protein CTI12_AA211690 [Artemisia annua]|uniref:Zinc finger, CCHC-type n=1 Tax=Artemisia annua TaxID=35608 RepID=A0A2U1MLS6_ARTAN|nr:hypothetical protein CTI12_AA211690 [Artemisia annua]
MVVETSKKDEGGMSMTLQCPILDSTNYTIWAIKIKALFNVYGIWGALEPQGEVDTKKNTMAIAYLFQALPEQLTLQVAHHTKAAVMWKDLKARFVGIDKVKEARLQTLELEFETLKMKDSESLDEFTGKISQLVSQASNLGTTIENKRLVRKLLGSIPTKFIQIVAAIEQFADLNTMTFQEAFIIEMDRLPEELMKLSSSINGVSFNIEFLGSDMRGIKEDIGTLRVLILRIRAVFQILRMIWILRCKMTLEEWYLVDLFICGLPLEFGNDVKFYKPKTLSDAYCLAVLKESTHNFIKKELQFTVFSSKMINESKEMVKNSMWLKGLDEVYKDDVKCSETELKTCKFDDSSKCVGILDELCREKVKCIEMESNDFVDSADITKWLVVTDSFVNEDDGIGEKNKIMGLSSLVSGSESIVGPNGSELNKSNLRSLGYEQEINAPTCDDHLYKEEKQKVHKVSHKVNALSGVDEHKSMSSKALKELNNDNDVDIKLLINKKETTQECLRDHSKKLEKESLKVVSQKEQKESSIKGNKMFSNKVCRQKSVYLLEICHDLRYVEGWEDEDKDLYVFACDSNVHNLSTKVLTCEKEFIVNNKQKEDLEKVTTHFAHMPIETWNWLLVCGTANICKLEMIKLGTEVKRNLSDVELLIMKGIMENLISDQYRPSITIKTKQPKANVHKNQRPIVHQQPKAFKANVNMHQRSKDNVGFYMAKLKPSTTMKAINNAKPLFISNPKPSKTKKLMFISIIDPLFISNSKTSTINCSLATHCSSSIQSHQQPNNQLIDYTNPSHQLFNTISNYNHYYLHNPKPSKPIFPKDNVQKHKTLFISNPKPFGNPKPLATMKASTTPNHLKPSTTAKLMFISINYSLFISNLKTSTINCSLATHCSSAT